MFLLGAAVTLLTAYGVGVRLFGKLGLPPLILFALGAAIESLLVYLLFLDRLGFALLILAAFIPFVFITRRVQFHEPSVAMLDSPARWLLFPILAIFGVYYTVQALAPEIQPDAISYHLGLVAEYLRLGAFPYRIGFYEILPQGMEMLFAMAYSIGTDSAAKLVHFACLVATFPLIVLTARRLKLTDSQGYIAATLYVLAPVVGLSGTCAYNDAALVFFTLATFYLLLLGRPGCAGLTAGFCYAIKFTGLFVPVLAVIFIVWKVGRAASPAILRFAAGALLMIAPWMLRAFLLTRNPLAPLFNNLFPNLYFNAVAEKNLAHALSSYPGFHWPTALWAWGITGVTQGVIGPLILAAPLAYLAWRKPNGRLLLITATLLLAPVAFNVGARFLMPSLPFFALALTVALPQPAVLALTLVQAIVCFPPIIVRFEEPMAWALRDFPWRAALRLQSEAEYLDSAAGDYMIARYIETHTQPGDRIFALKGISESFTTREILEFWHSNLAQRYTAALQAAFAHSDAVKTRAEWPPTLLTAIRFVSTADFSHEWSVFDVRFFSPGGFIYNSPQWTLRASPNPGDSPAAFDGNRATFWTTRIPQHRGMYLGADFDRPQLLNSVQVIIAANAPQPGFQVEGRPLGSRQWQLLSDRWQGKVTGPRDLRSDAARALYLAGFHFISVYAADGGLGLVASDMVKHPREWNLKDLGGIGDFHLMRIEKP